jgi:hypothetical protein
LYEDFVLFGKRSFPVFWGYPVSVLNLGVQVLVTWTQDASLLLELAQEMDHGTSLLDVWMELGVRTRVGEWHPSNWMSFICYSTFCNHKLSSRFHCSRRDSLIKDKCTIWINNCFFEIIVVLFQWSYCNICDDSAQCVLKPSQQQQNIYRIANGTYDNQHNMQYVDIFCKFVIQDEVSNHIKLTNYTQYFWN